MIGLVAACFLFPYHSTAQTPEFGIWTKVVAGTREMYKIASI